MADRIGQQLGNYRLDQLLGSGGFAQVYLGTHVHLGTQAAVKLLLAPLATAGEIEKFRREAQTIASLQHLHIVRLVDFGVEEGTPYLVLDYAPNGSLRQRFPAGSPLPAGTILPAVLQVASALQYAHEHHLVHRDVKPENLLVGRNNEVLLTDFGIATVAQNTSQQRTEGVAGTAAYMAPEQLQGKPRPASDLYALGVVVYEWLCGERPFVGGPLEVATQHLTMPPPPLREKVPTIPPAVEQVVLTTLAKDPKERFGSMRAFANAFQQACGEAGSAYLLSAQAIRPPALPPTSQEGGLVSGAPAQPGVPSTGQAEPAGASIFSATTHLSPQVTPPLTPSSMPAELGGQKGPSLFSAETHLLSPAPMPATPNLPSRVPASSSAGTSGVQTRTEQTRTAPTTPPAPGWATPEPPAEGRWLIAPGELLPPTAEGAYAADGSAVASGARPPTEAPAPPGAPTPKAGKRQGKGGARRWALVVAASLVVLALIGGGGVYGLPLLLRSLAATGATVTITPAKSDVKNTFNLTGVTSTPDASKQQVGARMISINTPAQTKTVPATGQGTTPGTHLTGTFDVNNNDTANPLNIAAGSTFPNMSSCAQGNLTIVLDGSVSLPPSSSTTTPVPGHILQVGAVVFTPNCSPTLYYQSGSCGGQGCTVITPYTFTNGTDPQTYTAVAQSDIDNAANSLIQAHQPDAQQVIQGQLHSNEQLAGTQQCQPNTNADHQAGDQASQVTVTVSFTCTGQAYDHDGALALAKQLLTSQAATTPGTGYALVGQIKTTLVSATPDTQGAVAIVVQAEGIWVYQFTDAEMQALAQLIAGKSQQEAMSVLAAQTGVAKASIKIQGGNGQTLPTNPQKITLVIQPVSGL